MNWFICPFSRPTNVNLVESNWLNQNAKTNLLVIANGCEYKGKATHVISILEKSAIKALNIGIEYLKQNHSKDNFARMDDDDIYLPGYIKDVEYSLIDSDYSTIPVTNVKLTNNEIIQFGIKSSHIGSGGTIAGKISKSCYFRNIFPLEDYHWCEDMYNLKKKFKGRNSNNYIRVRHADCVSKMTDEQFKMAGVFE
jgi:hypothetical protein